MKHKQLAFLAVALLFLVGGCQSNQNNSSETSHSSKKTTETSQKKTETSTSQEKIKGEVYQGEFELPLDGASGYASISLNVKSDVTAESTTLETLAPGTGFTVLAENNGWLQIKTDTQTGWVQSQYALVNLPDLIPSIVYNDTNVSGSIFRTSNVDIPDITGVSLYNSKDYNDRLEQEQYIMPVLYPMTKKIMAAQQQALSENNTIILYEAFRPLSVQVNAANKVQALAAQNPTVKAGITTAPWSIDWFIVTSISNHQVGYAMDVSIGQVTETAEKTVGKYQIKQVTGYSEYAMQTPMHELSNQSALFTGPVDVLSKTAWQSASYSPSVNQYTVTLQKYMTDNGLTPLASEWWHFNDLDTLYSMTGYTGTGDYILTETKSLAPK
ncbi:SH3 domain-containing protein [Enterococcus sp. AZ103]|uniref:SH3 domain-containing protein n=1 Tax=Enterococcus sp. AZ103 TaxID=2774628 RepID=UPI003F26E29D